MFFSLVDSYSSGMVAVYCGLLRDVIPNTFERAV